MSCTGPFQNSLTYDFSEFLVALLFRGMFNKERIAKMKKGVIVVNNARGAIMDTQAVADACSSGHIAGTYICSFIFFSFYILVFLRMSA